VTLQSKHIGVVVDRPVSDVYDYAADPANLAEWAPGLGGAVSCEDGVWYVETTEGRVGVRFAERNDLGVLDHWVSTTSGAVVYVPMRVFANEDGSEIVFSVRRSPDMSDEEFERDAGLVTADLDRLRRIVEQRSMGAASALTEPHG
jgi:hypothetical protein